MATPPSPVLAQLAAQLAQSSRRLMRLENDVTEAEIMVKKGILQQKSLYGELDHYVSFLDERMQGINDEITTLLKHTGKVMVRFKDLVKVEGVRELEMRVDDLPLEEYMTRKEFLRLLKEKI